MDQTTPSVIPLAVDSSARIIRSNIESSSSMTAGSSKVNEKSVRLKAEPRSPRLQIRSTRKGGQESWTVATTSRPRTKGSKHTSFRIRVSDVGYRVCLVYYDEEGKRREPYLCYLSAREWRQAKKGTLVNFAQLVLAKLAERMIKENADNGKLAALSRRVEAFL